MAFNPNELIIDRVRSIRAYDTQNGEMKYRLSQIEEPSLSCTSEGEEVTDAVGSLITTLYRAKKATFSGTNSLFSLDLAAAQFGTDKENGKVTNYYAKVITVSKGTDTVELEKTPVENSLTTIYAIEGNGLSTKFTAGEAASETEFRIEGNTLTVPTDFEGQLFVDFAYEVEEGVRVVNMSDEFPKTVKLIADVILRDPCDDNTVYAGTILAERAKLTPESVEIALTSTGKHGFEYQLFKNYCDEKAALFEIIVSA